MFMQTVKISEFYFTSKLNKPVKYYLNCVTDIYMTI
jgi:hypothetical protein